MPTEPKSIPANESPIKDSNNDGILQGSELRAQLRQEEQEGSKRTKGEAVHGVLETAGVREEAQEYAELLLSAQLSTNPSKAIKEVETYGAKKITALLEATGTFMESPRLQEVLKNDLEKLKANPNFPEDQKEVIIADAANFAAFGKSLNNVFPKGIKIEPQDATEIMSHFARMPAIIRKKNEGNII